MENNVSNEVNRVETNISEGILAELFLEQMLCGYKKIQILKKIDQPL
ncbi:phosphoesterase [Priestia megaterium]